MHRKGRPRETQPEAALKRLLEGPGIDRALAAALRPLGLRPATWSHLRSHHRPGAGISALYQVQAIPRVTAAGSAPAGSAPAGSRGAVQLQIGATTAALTPAAAADTVAADVGGTAVRLWVHPRDPVLSGLPWATNAAAVGRDVFGSDAAPADLSIAAYRPLRRAVIRADFGGSRVFLKVPQPRLAAGLRLRLAQAAAAGLPVPALLEPARDAAPGAESVLVLAGLPGHPLHGVLRTAGAAALDPAALTDLLDRLPAGAMAFPRRPAWADRVLDYAGGAAVALAAESDRITRCASDIAAVVRTADPGPLVPAHGDFHGGNLLARTTGGTLALTGLLDVDALGPGRRVDDLACFLGHLQVLAALHPDSTELRDAAARCARSFARSTDPAALYGRSAAVALTLVAGAAGRGPQAAARTLAAAEDLLRLARTA